MKPTAMSDADHDAIETLVARGAYAEAAARAEAAGDLRRALALYQRIWRFADATRLARALGDWPKAVELALDAGDPAQALAIAAQIPDQDTKGLARAAAALAGRGQAQGAAELEERAGRLAQAAALYRKTGAPLEAGRLLERLGQFQEAGRLYEQIAALGGGAADRRETAEARLALGRLLGRLGRPREAARALQAAARFPETRTAAQHRLCAELLALGLPHAAAEIARRLHDTAPGPAPEPEAIAAAERAGEAAVEESPALPRRYRVLGTLGGGAWARIFAAQDELLGRTVALKVLAVGPGAVGPEREAFARFVREAEAAGRLRHPHIVGVHDIDETAGLMALEHLPGGTLYDKLAAGRRLSPASVRRLGGELLSALGAAHRAGIVHRDVKPANTFFDAAGNAKLGDFGAAHLLEFGHTQTGSFIGTLAYLSPEQITGAAITFAADLYGLGATLYEALTGRPPFLGPDLVAQHLSETPRPPSAFAAGLTPEHDRLILRALAKAPADRFPSAEAMAEALERWPAFDPLVRPDAVDALENVASPAARTTLPRSPPARRPLGRTARGQLVLTTDPTVGREVLLEELDEPLGDVERARLGRLAAAGGPHVQRVLSLSADSRTITYERLPGPALALADLSQEEKRQLEPVWPALASLGLWPGGPVRVARAPGGPVVLVVETAPPDAF